MRAIRTILLLFVLCNGLDAQQPEALWMHGGHAGEVNALLFSPDSRTLYSDSADGLIRIWSPLDRRLVRVIESGSGTITSMAITADGSRLAVAGVDGSIRIWDVGAMSVLSTMQGDGPVRSIAIAPDGSFLVSGHAGGELDIWGLDSARLVRRLVGHTADVNSVALSPDARTIASAASDFSLRLWDVATGAESRKIFTQGNDYTSVAFSPDGLRLVVNAGVPDAPDALKLTLYDLPAMTATSAPNAGHRAAITGLAFSPDSRYLASISEDYYLPGFIPAPTIVVSDLSGVKPMFRLQEGNREKYGTSLRFSPDGRFLAWGLASGIIRIREIGEDDDPTLFSADTLTLTDHYAPVRAVAISPDGSMAASASGDAILNLFDAATGRPSGHLEGHTETIGALAFSPDGATLASAAADRTVRLWSVAGGRERRMIYVSPEFPATAVGFSPDGSRFVVGLAAGDSSIAIWDTASSMPSRMFVGHSGGVTDLLYTLDGEMLISSGNDGQIHIWDVATGAIDLTLVSGSVRFSSLALSANGRILAAAGSNGTIRTWSIPSGDPLVTLSGHRGRVTSVDLSDDGSLAVSSGLDGTVRVWSLDLGEEIHRYIEHPFEHLAVALDDGTGRLLSGSADATVIMWRLLTVSAAPRTSDRKAPALAVRSVAPNPSSDRTTLELVNPRPAIVEAEIFDAAGRKVATLHSGWLDAGVFLLEWRPAGLPAGEYFYRVSSGGESVGGMIVRW